LGGRFFWKEERGLRITSLIKSINLSIPQTKNLFRKEEREDSIKPVNYFAV
jgi:hypothetical protein